MSSRCSGDPWTTAYTVKGPTWEPTWKRQGFGEQGKSGRKPSASQTLMCCEPLWEPVTCRLWITALELRAESLHFQQDLRSCQCCWSTGHTPSDKSLESNHFREPVLRFSVPMFFLKTTWERGRSKLKAPLSLCISSHLRSQGPPLSHSILMMMSCIKVQTTRFPSKARVWNIGVIVEKVTWLY